jgi:hypothetical protein
MSLNSYGRETKKSRCSVKRADKISVEEFIKPKILEKLEEIRTTKEPYRGVKTDKLTYIELNEMALKMMKEPEFLTAYEQWGKDYKKQYPSTREINKQKRCDDALKKMKAEMCENNKTVIENPFGEFK